MICDGVLNVKKNELKAWVGKVLNACNLFFNISKIIFAKPSLQKKFKIVSSTLDIAKKKGKKEEKDK